MIFKSKELMLGNIILFAVLFSIPSFSKDMGETMSCPMCGAMGWGGMILGGLLILALIAALGALALFLVRRSRRQH